jgi:hypothetical protein
MGRQRPRQGGWPGKSLHRVLLEDDDEPTPASPPPPPRRRLVKPVTFIAIQTPGLALGTHHFEQGRLVLTDAEEIARVRKHPWYGNRILEDTPKMRAQIDLQRALYGQQRFRNREQAEDAQSYRRLMGPRGPLIPR